MRFLPIFLLIGLFFCVGLTGCGDRPEVSPKTYGTVLKELPYIAEAEEPFKFPHAGENDHQNCEFNEEDFF